MRRKGSGEAAGLKGLPRQDARAVGRDAGLKSAHWTRWRRGGDR